MGDVHTSDSRAAKAPITCYALCFISADAREREWDEGGERGTTSPSPAAAARTVQSLSLKRAARPLAPFCLTLSCFPSRLSSVAARAEVARESEEGLSAAHSCERELPSAGVPVRRAVWGVPCLAPSMSGIPAFDASLGHAKRGAPDKTGIHLSMNHGSDQGPPTCGAGRSPRRPWRPPFQPTPVASCTRALDGPATARATCCRPGVRSAETASRGQASTVA